MRSSVIRVCTCFALTLITLSLCACATRLDPRSVAALERYCGYRLPDADPALTFPKVIHDVPPARRDRNGQPSGWACLEATVSADGSVRDVIVTKCSDPRVGQAASEAISQWRYRPATRNGEPIDFRTTYLVAAP